MHPLQDGCAQISGLLAERFGWPPVLQLVERFVDLPELSQLLA